MDNDMKAIHRILLLAVVAVQLASCGLLDFDVDETGVLTPTEMYLEQDTFYVMRGETFSLHPVFTPDTVNITDLYMLPMHNDIVTVCGADKLEAIGEGSTKIYIISVSARIQDSCMVFVSAPWLKEERVWPYETVFYANVTLNGEPLPEGMEVAAFVGNECRGKGVKKSAYGINYWQFRVGSDILYDDNSDWDDGYCEDDEYDAEDIGDGPYRPQINFRVYDQTHHKLYTTAIHAFFDGETHGTLSELFEINF